MRMKGKVDDDDTVEIGPVERIQLSPKKYTNTIPTKSTSNDISIMKVNDFKMNDYSNRSFMHPFI